ncbi:Aste57867_7012 [Aphanomyces stellatus]|uniref:Aste57867_1589 protein n=1 Tax=Aphanomyces stellatus TaxID=120398 RepID=A0A485KHH6_9STRA|nr:hypothetical protein As57867_006989 [Aphanomyces stellatus]KAF0718596.1 hypothetical protein As57867_001588 [Aphanomyces stellatus]VFT78802.1 Aste57867_1589 [Aphanomyces stellatus]VFT83961.1 Aste57867_7012 [Aphanomyces stellatus]
MVVKAGQLYRRNSKLLWWRPRWASLVYTLTHDSLLAYDSQSGQLTHSISLASCVLEPVPITTADDGLPWRLCLKTPLKRVTLAAPSQKELQEWLDAFQSVLPQATSPQCTSTRASSFRSSGAMSSVKSTQPRRHSTVVLKSSLNESLEPYNAATPARSASQHHQHRRRAARQC